MSAPEQTTEPLPCNKCGLPLSPTFKSWKTTRIVNGKTRRMVHTIYVCQNLHHNDITEPG